MNHKEKLIEIYNLSYSVDDIKDITEDICNFIITIGENINTQKGVFTVLVTLITHKILYPKQDVRFHQSGLKGGFSGRTIDTQFITPTLKQLGLPSMAESGWLTRSLEQNYPYNLNYNGKISNKKVKEAFLRIIDYIQNNPKLTNNVLRLLLFQAIKDRNNTFVPIIKMENFDYLHIDSIISALDEHFRNKYSIHGGSKLPVLAFFAIYKCLISELKRYNKTQLANLGSHTASDKTSKTAGDIEIFKSKKLFEAIEIKLDKEIDIQIVRIAIEKIIKYNPKRYYILSYKGIKENDLLEIKELTSKLQNEHGCQLIINGLLPTIKYYLRLISSLENFITNYSELIEKDKELQKIHKEKWNELILTYLSNT